jgi:hypothetical protein
VATVITLRFTGGPLDGRTQQTDTAAQEYRTVGGAYRRVFTHRRLTPEGDIVAVSYRWQAENAERWHTPEPELV